MDNMKESKRNTNAVRGIGRDRFEKLLKQRPSKKLKDGDHLLYHHALRCLCQYCGKLLDWDCPADLSYTISECCGVEYRLMPWTVKIETIDISSRPILPKLKGSSYSDPSLDLSEHLVGNHNAIASTIARPLSTLQRGLGTPTPTTHVSEPRTYVIPAKGYLIPTSTPQVPEPTILAVEANSTTKSNKRSRRCSICKKTGHNRRKCPTLAD